MGVKSVFHRACISTVEMFHYLHLFDHPHVRHIVSSIVKKQCCYLYKRHLYATFEPYIAHQLVWLRREKAHEAPFKNVPLQGWDHSVSQDPVCRSLWHSWHKCSFNCMIVWTKMNWFTHKCSMAYKHFQHCIFSSWTLKIIHTFQAKQLNMLVI